jgi:hypothetical protein
MNIVHDLGEQVGGPAVPRSLQKALIALLAAVGQRLGYRASYAQYSETTDASPSEPGPV